MKFEELEDSQQQVARMIEHAIQKFEVRQEAERLERERRQREAQLEREHRVWEIAPFILAAFIAGLFTGMILASSLAPHLK